MLRVLAGHDGAHPRGSPGWMAAMSATRRIPAGIGRRQHFGDDADDEPRRKPWAWLLRHVFEVDVTTCPRCSGPMRWIEAATVPDAIARLLAKHGLGPRPPPARSAPLGQLRLAFSGA